MKKLILFVILSSVFIITGCTKNEKLDVFEVSFFVDGAYYDKIDVIKNEVLYYEDIPVLNEKEGEFFDGWYLDVEYCFKFEELAIYQNTNLYGRFTTIQSREEEVLESIILPQSANSSIELLRNIDEFQITWVSSHPHILDEYGNYNYFDFDQIITLTASIQSTQTYYKSFEILITPYPYEEVFNNIKNQFLYTNPVSDNLNLELVIPTNVSIFWESSNQNVLNNQGIVIRTTIEEDVNLKLKIIAYGIQETYEFQLKIAAKELSIEDAEYFVHQLEEVQIEVNIPILSKEQIYQYNEIVLNTIATKTKKLETISTSISKNNLIEKIEAYNFFHRYSIYHNQSNLLLTNLEKDAILENRNLMNVPEEVSIQYAISVTHTSLRSYPTHHYANSNTVDRFQETGFSLGVPMIVYQQSLDQNWYFVEMYNYSGWVSANDIGICSREVFLQFVNPSQFIIVLKPILELENEKIRMGYQLPYIFKTESEFTLLFPKRISTGFLELTNLIIENSNNIHDGFLVYNYSNLLHQAFSFVGTKYSWGDKIVDGFDCSSTQSSIYMCFGFKLGRNTSNQWSTAVYGDDVSNLTNLNINNYSIGTLFYTSGHVLMYIGTDKEGKAWMLHNTSSGNICKLQTLDSYGADSIRYSLELQ